MPLCLTFDIEPDLHTEEYKGVIEGIQRILNLLNKYKIKATFFITCDCLEKFPEIFKELKKENHEIALHAYKHERFDDLDLKEKELQIQKAILCFQKYLHSTPEGFRAPQFSIDNETLNLLQKYNFKYDSSFSPFNALEPLFFPRKFFKYLKLFFSSIKKYKIRKNLYELPSSSFIISFSSIIFRVFPVFLIRAYFAILKLLSKDIIFYAHSWDFIDLPKSRIARTFTKERFINSLDKFLSIKGNKFCRMVDLI